MNQDKIPFTQVGHPFYFGTYLNMARHNAFMILKSLTEKYKDDLGIIEDKLEEDNLHQASLLNKLGSDKLKGKPDVILSLLRDLKQHFPFLNHQEVLNAKDKLAEKEGAISLESITNLNDILRGGVQPPTEEKKKDTSKQDAPYLQPKEIAELLLDMLSWMHKLRNFFSHKGSTPKFDFKQPQALYKIYDAAVFRLVDRNKRTKRYDVYTEHDIEHLQRTLAAAKAKRVPYNIVPNVVDDKSLTFFICLFLEPKYASMFLSRLEGFRVVKNPDEEMPKTLRATWRCYAMFCCRLPQPKLESSDILLDMLNELSRCPDDLYHILSDTDKNYFKVKTKAEADKTATELVENDAENDTNTEGVEQEVILKRHEDRFPNFALRYFDDTDAFPNLRFQVHIGKYLKKDPYNKTIFGEPRERELLEPIRTFAKLSPLRDKYDHVNQDDPSERIVDAFYAKEFIEKRWAEDKSGKVILKADIEQFSPRYNFGKQTIAFKLVSHPTDNVLPRLDFTVKKDTKGNIERNLTKDKTDNEVFIISNYELRNLFVYNHLHQKGDAEKLIREYAENMRRLFYDIKFGQFLPLVAPPHFKKGEKKPFDKNPQRRKQLQDNYTQQQEAMNERRLDLAEILETEYNLPYNALPKDLREYLLAYKDVPYAHAAKEKLTKQFKDVQERQKMVNKQKQPNRGGMATYLAEDIVFMMPPRPHGLDANGDPHYQKLNNDQFRVLQSSIAFFLINRDNIKSFFTELGLNEKDSPYQHPFLHKVNVTRCSGVLHFYSEYLGVKERFLYDAINFIHDEKKRKYANADEVRTRYGHILPINERKAIEKNYDKTPLLLPKGFFNQAIAQAVNAPVKEGFSGFNNVVYNLEYLLNADTQPFYMPDSETQTFLHYYRKPVPNTEGVLIEKTVFMPELETDIQRLADEKRFNKKLKDDEKQVVKNALQETIRIKDFILEREQTLRYHQTNDRAMWLMVKGISDYRFKTNDKEAVSIDFHENGEENPFLLRGIKFIEEAEAKRVADETGATERKIWNVLDKEVKMSLKVSGKRIIDELPVKRHGDFRRILKDRRIENLVKYYDQPEISYTTIKIELDIYDRRRIDFFKLIDEFEGKILSRYQADFPTKANDGTYSYKDFMAQRGLDVKSKDNIKDYFPHNLFMLIATDHLEDKEDISKYNEDIVQLRNKFLHNEFPFAFIKDGQERLSWLKEEVDKNTKPYITDRIFDIAETYYKAAIISTKKKAEKPLKIEELV